MRRLGWSKEEALLGAVPGAMAAVLALASHIKTPPQKIVISHSLRLITLTLLAGYLQPDWKPFWPDVLVAMP
ncbi:AbrB family transcriptional regulator [Citrobacter sp. FDAARGOS_156]|uniref:AbrB family transcriptional regulator n=1 Tax=Citrobacter sp. FDAARGOS_156 TaxID=1702170 RepID=UPI00351BEEC1